MPRKSNKQREKEKAELYQQRFKQLCEEVENGRLVREKDKIGRIGSKTKIKGEDVPGRIYQEEYPDVPITEDTFVMAYADLPEDNVFSTCRKQLPKQWFVSQTGEVIAYENGEWRWETSQGGQDRREYKKQYGIRETMYNTYEMAPKFDTNKNTRKKKGKHARNIESHVLTGIVYEARVLGKRAEEVLKKYGLDCLGVKPKGKGLLYAEGITAHHINGYYEDKNKSYVENMSYNNKTEQILFMTNRVHDAIENLIHAINNLDDSLHFSKVLQETLAKEDPGKIYIVKPKLTNEEHQIVDYNDYELTIKQFGKSGEKIPIFANKKAYADIVIIDKNENIFDAIGSDKVYVAGFLAQDEKTGEVVAYRNEKSVYRIALLLKHSCNNNLKLEEIGLKHKICIFECRNKGENIPMFGALMRKLVNNYPNTFEWLVLLPYYEEYCKKGKPVDTVEVVNEDRDLKYTITCYNCIEAKEEILNSIDGLVEIELDSKE